MFNFFKCIMMVLGNVEDECTFSNLVFMKLKLRNQLTTHLDLVVKMYGQTFYTLDTFPFYPTICNSNDHEWCYGVQEKILCEFLCF
jgi:hypothetical protein